MIRIAALLVASGIAGCGGAAARWIDDAASRSAQVDALLREGQLARARSLLEALVALPVPASVAEQDRRAVLQDAYARLSLVALRSGAAADAKRYADAGLALGEHRDVFTSALRTMRGRAEEALGNDAEAARDYEAAQVIAELLLQASLGGGDR
jgi:hypothetical protein